MEPAEPDSAPTQARVRIRLTHDGAHLATGTVRANITMNSIIITLGGQSLRCIYPTTFYPMLDNIKPLRYTTKIRDYISHPQHDDNNAPTHHIDLRPTILGGSLTTEKHIFHKSEKNDLDRKITSKGKVHAQ